MEYDPNTPMNFSKPIHVMPQKSRIKVLDIYLAVFFAVIPHTLLIGAYIRHTNIKQSIEMDERVKSIKRKIEQELEDQVQMYYMPPRTSRYTAPPTPPPPSGNLRCMNGTLLKREGNTWLNIGDC